jgi:hypothetical protein
MKKIPLFEDNEVSSYDDLVNTISAKLSGYKRKEYQALQGKSVMFSQDIDGNGTCVDVIDSSSKSPEEPIYLSMDMVKIIPGESLDDNTKNYRTTSATKFKTKKKKVRNYYKTPALALKAFNKFME